MLKYFIYFLLYFTIVKTEANFGQFDARITNYINCKGPKRKSCGDSTQTVIGSSSVRYNFYIKENMSTLKAKITGNLNDREILLLHWRNSCENMFMKPLLQVLYNVTDNCSILKGTYKFTVDIQSLARTFYGGKFMYGNWTTKVLFYTIDCNMHCGIIRLALSPAKSYY